MSPTSAGASAPNDDVTAGNHVSFGGHFGAEKEEKGDEEEEEAEKPLPSSI